MIARMLPGFLLAPVRRRARRPVEPQGRDGDAATSDAPGCSSCCRSSTTCSASSSSRSSSKCSRCCGVRPRKRPCRTSCSDPEQLASANSLSLVAAYGTFPLGAILFASLAGVAKWLGDFDALDGFGFDDKESLAIWFDALTKLVAAFLDRRARASRIVPRPESVTARREPDVPRHRRRLPLHPLAPARARRDDRPRGRAHRRWRGRSRSARCSPTPCSAAAAAASAC